MTEGGGITAAPLGGAGQTQPGRGTRPVLQSGTHGGGGGLHWWTS